MKRSGWGRGLVIGCVAGISSLLLLVVAIFASVAYLVSGPTSSSALVAPTVSSIAVADGAVPDEYQEEFDYALTLCPALSAPVFAAQITAESNWYEDAWSPAGARGLGQVMPSTWREFAVDANGGGAIITDPADSLATAAAYDCHVLSQVTGKGYSGTDDQLMLAGYNAGPGAVAKYDGVPPYAETENYVEKIEAAADEIAVAVEVPGQVVAGSLPSTPLPHYPIDENGLSPNTEFGRHWIDSNFGTVTPPGFCAADSGHIKGSYHYTGHACDITMGSIGEEPDAATLQLGWAISNSLVENHVALGVVQVIWQGQIWTSDRGEWRDYTHPSGSDSVTLNHRDHVHVSFDRSRDTAPAVIAQSSFSTEGSRDDSASLAALVG